MSEKKRVDFSVCGLNLKYFLPFFIVVMVVTYGGFMPTVKIYSNDAGTYMATSFIQTWAFLMAGQYDSHCQQLSGRRLSASAVRGFPDEPSGIDT